MKMIYLSLALGAFLMLASCKKDYTCTCSSTNLFLEETTTESYTIRAGHKSEAALDCDEGDYESELFIDECEIQ
jgi:hypothetical protein